VLAELGVPAACLNPLRVALLAGLSAGLLAIFPRIGLLRGGALLGALLAGLSFLALSVNAFLELPSRQRVHRSTKRPRARPRSSSALFVLIAGAALVSTAAAAGAPRLVRLADIERHAGDVLFVADGPRGRHVVTRVQGIVNSFSNDVLTVSATDGRRFAEALVHPALAFTPRPRRVLVLGDGSGAIEREVLRFEEVESITSVFPDRRLSDLAARSALLRPLGGEALADPRVRRVELEAARFVANSQDRYDVIVADFGDPTSYREGKHYSRVFLSRVKNRLTEGGHLGIQITSPLRTPRAHGSIASTLHAAGFGVALYRAPLPTLGEWGFALARNAPEPIEPRQLVVRSKLPVGSVLVDARTLRDMFVPASDALASHGPVNVLHDQPVVELYRTEEQQWWE
jgi:spermidine synthase